MMISTCFCHFPDGTEGLREVNGDPTSRGSQITIDGQDHPWHVTKHTPTAEDLVTKWFDAEVWVDREAPPPAVDH